MENYKIRTLIIDEKCGKTIIYYISKHVVTLDEILDRSRHPLQDNGIIASAHVGWWCESQIGNEATIVGLNVEDQFQNLGIGSKLLERIILDAQATNVDMIKVDDMSERYHKNHNIYTKFGFDYVDPTGGPEMVLYM